ncbi:hypothetical protein BD410DRAFT_397445 [Rickenella mellea]|uniref:F-box domain-containing protein n=1 Tax=Rickenella mellea TaxID=50990 RepID=A0A4Y7PWL7_9AGAM|nr:hypothetical protein BD410DRAFT_397445 [Rickenella mellea]
MPNRGLWNCPSANSRPRRVPVLAVEDTSYRLSLQAHEKIDCTILLLEGNTPKLEDLKCIIYDWTPVFVSRPFALSSALHLKRLCVLGAPFPVDFGDQVHQLQFIDIRAAHHGRHSLADLVKCLTQGPSLTTSNLSIYGPSSIAQRHYLHTLNLGLSAANDPYLLFDRLFLPSIKHLDLMLRRCTTADWPHLASMLKRSCPPLTYLYLHGVPMT